MNKFLLKDVLRSPEGDEGSAGSADSSAELEKLKQQNADLLKETEAMRAKMQELLDEAKKAKDVKRQAEMEAQKAAAEKAKNEGDFEQLLKSSEAERETLKSELEQLKRSIKAEKINGEAAKLASKLTKDTVRAELLAEKFAQRLTLTDDGIKVLDEAGQLTVSPIDDLVTQISSRYQILVDGSQASGGGATGANGSAGMSKKWSDYSTGELSDIRKQSPEEYERLRATR